MSITILRGLPGSGKSARMIQLVNEARRAGHPVLTFACSESPWLRRMSYIRRRELQCRQPGLTCPLDHFVTAEECAQILSQTPPGTLVVFDPGFDCTGASWKCPCRPPPTPDPLSRLGADCDVSLSKE